MRMLKIILAILLSASSAFAQISYPPGVTSIFAGSGISLNANTGAVTITNAAAGSAGSTLFTTVGTGTGPSNTATETSIIPGGAQTIAANTFTDTAAMEVVAQGYFSLPAVADSLVMKYKCGSTTLGSASFTFAAGVVTDGVFKLNSIISASGTGASGNFMVNTIFEATGGALTPTEAKMLNKSLIAYDFTTSCAFDVTAKWGAAQSGESISGTNIAAWIPGAPVTSVAGKTGAVTLAASDLTNGVSGSGAVGLVTSPTFVTPTIGAATATTVNKVTITAPATAATLTIANNKTLTASNTLTLAGTDSTTLTFQGTDTYVGRATTDTLTNKTFDTAGTGNSFKINGTAISAVTGTGSAVLSAAPTFTGKAIFAATQGTDTADTDGSTVTFDASASNIHHVTLAGNRTLAISNGTAGQIFTLRLIQDGMGSRTVTWFTTIKWAGGSAPTLTTTAAKEDDITCLITGSNTYNCTVAGANF